MKIFVRMSKNVKVYEYDPQNPVELDNKRDALCSAWYKAHGPTASNIQSYDWFVKKGIPKIFMDNRMVIPPVADGETPPYIVEFGEITCDPFPQETDLETGKSRQIFPMVAEKRKLNYAVSMMIDVKVIRNVGATSSNEPEYHRIPLMELPVMVTSSVCSLSTLPREDPTGKDWISVGEDPMNQGGYFIIGGSRKMVIGQERSAFNVPYVFVSTKKKATAGRFAIYAEVRSSATKIAKTSTTTVGFTKDNYIDVILGDQPPNRRPPVPLGVMFKALGILNDNEIQEMIVPDGDPEMLALIRKSIELSYPIRSISGARSLIAQTYFGNKKTNRAKADLIEDILEKEMYSRQGVEPADFFKKAIYMAWCVWKMLLVKLGRVTQEDRDHFGGKLVNTVGGLMFNRFYMALQNLRSSIIKGCAQAMSKRIAPNPITFIKSDSMTKAMTANLKNGDWGSIKRGGPKKVGVSAQYEDYNYQSSISNMRKENANLATEGQVIEARGLNSSHLFMVCPSETPEGQQVGLIKNFALGCYVTLGDDPEPIIEKLKEISTNAEEFDLYILPPDFKREYLRMNLDQDAGDCDYNLPHIGFCKVFVDGVWIAMTDQPLEFVKHFRELRRQSEINFEMSISYDDLHNEVTIGTTMGRWTTPLIIIDEDGNTKITMEVLDDLKKGEKGWWDLVQMGAIDLVDAKEFENVLLSFYFADIIPGKHTHVCLHPCLMYGAGASTVPMPHCNQAPRITYQSAMSKQAIGIPSLNFLQRMDGTSKFVMRYPQKPLVRTKPAVEVLLVDDRPAGANAITFIMPMKGWNQEDAVAINRAALDRGMFISTHYTYYHMTVKTEKGFKLEIPDTKTCCSFKGPRRENYADHLDEMGLPEKDMRIVKGDIVLGMVYVRNEWEVKASGNEKPKVDHSVIFKGEEEGTIDEVQVTNDADGKLDICIRVRSTHRPELGDKFSSRHGY